MKKAHAWLILILGVALALSSFQLGVSVGKSDAPKPTATTPIHQPTISLGQTSAEVDIEVLQFDGVRYLIVSQAYTGGVAIIRHEPKGVVSRDNVIVRPR